MKCWCVFHCRCCCCLNVEMESMTDDKRCRKQRNVYKRGITNSTVSQLIVPVSFNFYYLNFLMTLFQLFHVFTATKLCRAQRLRIWSIYFSFNLVRLKNNELQHLFMCCCRCTVWRTRVGGEMPKKKIYWSVHIHRQTVSTYVCFPTTNKTDFNPSNIWFFYILMRLLIRLLCHISDAHFV